MRGNHVGVAAGIAALAIVVSAGAATIAPPVTIAGPRGAVVPRISLDDGWAIQSTAAVPQSPAVVSRPGFPTSSWYPVTVPSTVLGGLVADGQYADPYLRENLAAIRPARFAVPWWFRTEFELSDQPDARTWLHLDGINYRADVFLNGTRVASADQVIGTFRTYAFDVTDAVHPGTNALAVRVYPVDPRRDLTLTWIDWSPLPPDHGMGIWHDVWLSRTGPITVTDPQVTSALPLPSTATADLTVSATVTDATAMPLVATVRGTIGPISFSRVVHLAPGAAEEVSFDAATSPQLHLIDPPTWWPTQMGAQPLEDLTVTASVGGVESDRVSTTFGIRQVTSEYMPNGARRFRINGRPILIRGGGWAPDMLLRPVPRRVDDQLRYVKEMGLNTVRLEGKLESDHFFDEADRLGILVMPGWMCCDRWQQSRTWSPQERAIARASMASQATRLRNHPSVLTFLIGSDTEPVLRVQRMYANVLRAAHWPDPILASASGDTSSVLGPTGVKMTGPYDWVPPSYWYDPRAPGGADGFNTETSSGASIPELEDVRRMLSPGERRALWTEPRQAQFHAGVGDSVFKTFHIFDRAMTARLGVPTSLADYVEKAQVMAYENERAMFEAFSRNRYRSTGVIQWMLDNAWPSLHWNLFDWFLEPDGSTFGAKMANQPLHIQFSYDDRSVAVVNEQPQAASGLTATARVFDLAGTERWHRSSSVDVRPDGVARSFRVPQPTGISSTYFVELTLTDPNGAVVSRNVYWLSTSPETLAWRRSTWFFTPTKRYANLTALSTLPSVRPGITACTTTSGSTGMTRVTIANGRDGVAFFVRLRLTAGMGGRDVTPIDWSDGDLTLMPGERETVTATYRNADLRGASPVLGVGGWNVPGSATRPSACV